MLTFIVFTINNKSVKQNLNFQWHMENCEDRIKIDSNVYVKSDYQENRFPVPNITSNNDEENWDDVNIIIYNKYVFYVNYFNFIGCKSDL